MKPLAKTVQLSEEFLHRVVSSSPDCIKLLDLDGNLLAMNEGGQKVLELVDLTPHLGTCWTGWWKGGAHQEAQAAVQEALRGGMGRFEAFAETFGGTPKWWDVTVSPILGADGQIEHLLSVSRDVTRRKLAEQAAEELSELRRLALDSAQMGTWHLDLLAGRVQWDDQFKAIFGVADEDLSFERTLTLLHPDDREQVRAAIKDASRLVDPVPYAIEYRVAGPDGSWRWVQARGKTYYGGEGSSRRAVRLVGTVRDITAEKTAQEGLRSSEAKYRALFDSVDSAFCVLEMIWDEAGRPVDYRFVEVNSNFERHNGFVQAQGKTALELVPNLEARWFEIFGKVARTGEPLRFTEGSEAMGRFFDLYAFPLGGETNRRVAVIFSDISERRRTEEALRTSEARGAYVVRLSDALRPLSDPAEVQATAARTLGEHLGANRVAYFEIAGGDYVIDQDYANGAASFAGRHPVAAFGSLILDQLLAGETVAEADTSITAGRSAAERSAFASLGIGSIATVPLVKEGRFVAGLTAQMTGSRVWSTEDLWAVAETAERTWAGVERARVERSLRAKEAASRFLADLSETTRQTADPDVVLGTVVDSLRAHLSADRCAYAEVEDDQNTITIRHDRADLAGSDRSLVGRYELSSLGERILPALRAGKTVVVCNVATDPIVGDAKGAMAAMGVAAVVNVPLVKAGRLVAVLAVHELRPRNWTADEVALIEAVAERSWGEVERSRNIRALAFERHQLELIFQESPAAMTTWRGEDLVFTRINPEYQDIFRGRQLLGLPLMEACPELEGQGFDDLLRQVLRTGEPFTGREVLGKIQKGKDGPIEDRYFDFTYLQVRDADGNPWGVYDHAVDVTDRVLSRLALEQSQHDLRKALADREQLLQAEQAARTEAERIGRMKDEFLATLSHELRTPLNAILGWTQVLRGEPGNSEEVESGLATIERNARAQNGIIEDLLDMSKIISGKVRLDVQPLDLVAVVEAAVETVRPAAMAKGIRLQPVLDPQARHVTGDPNRLQQVFWNLLTNALKFTPRGGRVQVELQRNHSHLEVNVIDSGEGIAPEFLPHVFDRFRQQDASTTRKHGGLGLGLAIVKQLVELHGGSVHVDSVGLGQGTTFRVMLPLMAVQSADSFSSDEAHNHPQAATSAPKVSLNTLDLTGVKVLVVDDELDARSLIKRLLEDRGAIVRMAASVVKALEVMRTELPDVLVSDIGMPEQDGYALIRQLRALPPAQGGRLPALALTAYARSEDRMKAIMAGFQTHLAKPVEAAELLMLVANLASRT